MTPGPAVVTLEDVVPAVRNGYAMLAPESAGYLTLAVADAAMRRLVSLADERVELSLEGAVTLREGQPASPLEVEVFVRTLLARLLTRCATPPPALRTIVQRAAIGDVPALVDELEAALIPVNRAAAKRTLARLARETQRAPSVPPPPAEVSLPARPAERPAVVGNVALDEPTPPPEPSAPAPVVLPPVVTPSLDEPTPTPTPTIRMESPFFVGSPAPPPCEPEKSNPRVESLESHARTDELLAAFSASATVSERQMLRDLRAIADVDLSLTPPIVQPVASSSVLAPSLVVPARAGDPEQVDADDEDLQVPLQRSAAWAWFLGALVVLGAFGVVLLRAWL